MKILFTIILALFYSSIVHSQKNNLKDTLPSTDFLKKQYLYLDKNFKIKIDSVSFNKIVKKHKFIVERIINYNDSLAVVLIAEFGDWKISRIAQLRLTYTFDRVSLYTRIKSEKIKSLALKYNIGHPYNLQELFYKPNGNKDIIILLNKLRKKLIKETHNMAIKSMSNYDLLKFSFNNNTDVAKLKTRIVFKNNMRKFKEKHNREPNEDELHKLGKSCGKENCCQIR